MSSKYWTKILISVMVALFGAPGAARAQTRPEVSEEFHRSYPLAPGGRVSLSNINGKVRVTGWDRNEVRVDAVKRARTPERLRETEIKVDAEPNYVRIETQFIGHEGQRRDDEEGRGLNSFASVEYNISVPRGARLGDINLVNGPLDIEGISGAVHASTVSGQLTARGLSGTVKLSVVNGPLEASFDRLSEANSIVLGSVNGPIVLTIPSDANAILKAGTVSGGIANDFGLPVRKEEYVGRSLEGQLGNGGTSIKLGNVSGPITIRRADDGRKLSPATNLLSETRRHAADSDADDDDDAELASDEVKREITREMKNTQRQTQRQRREAIREAAREKAAAQLNAEEEAAEAAEDARRDAEEATRDLEREAEHIARDVARDTAKIDRKVLRETRKSVVLDESQRQIARETNSLETTGVPRIRIETFDGPVTVHAWDKSQVSYTAIKRAFDEKEIKGITVSGRATNSSRTESPGGATNSSSEILIRAEFDKSFAHNVVQRGGRVVSFVSGASVELDVYVPRNASLSISSGDGRLRVEGINGEIDLQTGDGPVDVTESRGRVRVNTGDGRIRIEGFDGDADARTGEGRIMLDGRFLQLAARTGGGTISLSLPEGSNAIIETSAESIVNEGVAVAEDSGETQKRVRRWRVGGGGANLYTLRTGEGQIILRRR